MIYVCIVLIILVYICYILCQAENKDRTRPFGLNKERNEKYTKKIFGEEYGVNTFWGKPHTKDNSKKMLDKIQWLNDGPSRDIVWRRAAIFSICAIVLYSIIEKFNF